MRILSGPGAKTPLGRPDVARDMRMVTHDNIQEWSWRVMLALALLVGFSFQGSRGLYETTEGRYVEVAREMVETGNWIEPTLGYRPHWAKPPLTYWAIAGGIKLLGVNEWGRVSTMLSPLFSL